MNAAGPIFSIQGIMLLDDVANFIKADILQIQDRRKVYGCAESAVSGSAYKKRIDQCISKQAVPHLSAGHI
jgi:hypothetical protein